MFTLGARSLGAYLMLAFFFQWWRVMRGDFDPTRCEAPLDYASGIVPLLSYLVLAWWLLFR
jgi:hypothetical protein